MIFNLLLVTSPILIAETVKAFYETEINTNQKAKKIFLFWCGFILFLFIALREVDIGSPDSAAYALSWKNYGNLSFKTLYKRIQNGTITNEIGYVFTFGTLAKIFPDSRWLFVFTGIFFSVSICRFLYFNSKDVVLSFTMFIALGLYSFMLNGLRQAIAICICLYAVEYCKKRKLGPFLLLVFLAYLYHRSALVFAPVYFLYGGGLDFSKKSFISLSVIVLILAAPIIIRLGNAVLDKEYADIAIESGGIVVLLIYLLIVGTSLLFIKGPTKNKLNLLNDKEKVYQQDVAFFVFLTAIGGSFFFMRYLGTQIVERLHYYFMIGTLIGLPNVIKRFDKSSRLVINSVVFLLCITLYMYRAISNPYQFFF